MKKIVITLGLILALLSSNNLFAQFNSSTQLFNASLGFGIAGSHNRLITDYNRRFSLPISLSFEKGINEFSIAPEYASMITVGVFLQYHNQYIFKDIVAPGQNFSYEVHRNYYYIVPGLMANFHFTPLLEETTINMDFSKLDIYAGLRVGPIIHLYRSNFENDPNHLDVQSGGIVVTDSFVGLGLGLNAGARYYFHPKLAVNMEVGFGMYSMSSIGITFLLDKTGK